MERRLAVCIIRNRKGELLLQKKSLDYKRGPGSWCLFGGKEESDDSNKEIQRELKEELGLSLKPKFIFTKTIKIGSETSVMNVFLLEMEDLSKVKLGEGVGFAFFHKKELTNLNLTPDVRIVLKNYFKK